MAAVNFPNSPVDGDTFTYEGKTFTWDNTNSIWVRNPAGPVVSVPSVLTDLSIVDGSAGQVLTTDGAGGFTFASGADQSNFATTGKAIAMAIVFGG
tara:strand:- start:334 stop:621 length:288 start_codon:yes stop_codon:yes gene_type:complete